MAAAPDAQYQCMVCHCHTAKKATGMFLPLFLLDRDSLSVLLPACSRLTDLHEESKSCHTLTSRIWLHRSENCQNLCFHIAVAAHQRNHTQRLSAEEPSFNLSFIIIY